ncbi:hypothetical protein SLEP1_g39627 [Rubroshorea leprosula]|uniref:non-specific serine/threonine protein kinase n=1 Tax=Rubroshorea leprosula TaxID=152421 RepID=A0AAV5L1F0_9ROSI|nr:hypothetical protein SLEP1_g39627 [Rubroshorea leprosula]
MKTENLLSWKSNSDPAPGDFSFYFDQNLNQFIIRNHSDTYWMSGWSGKYASFKDVPDDLISMMIPADNNNSYKTVPAPNNKKRLVMNLSGHIEFFTWMDGTNHWSLNWTKPSDVCSVYQVCGDYGVCSVGKNVKPNCTCLPGFKPKLKTEAGSTDYSRGCQRNIEGCSSQEDFFPVQLDKVSYPLSHFDAISEEDCIKDCKKKCCNAYFFESSTARAVEKNKPSTCWLWSSDEELKDLKSSDSFGGMIKVRFVAGTAASANFPIQLASIMQKVMKVGGAAAFLASTGIPNLQIVFLHSKALLLVIPLSTIAGIVFTAVAVVGIIFFQRKMTIRRAQRNMFEGKSTFPNKESDNGAKELVGFDEFQEDRTKSIDVPFYDFETIVAATDDFSLSNKLGQGGFGPVYKGKFGGGQEIAVKRLSKSSGQGLEEFKNEVVLIAKLQHRNLVRLLGYCMKGDEKMLIYEYLPNRSLDSIVFDPKKCLLLSWEMRYNIVVGVARGLQYLHQDSRLRIVHRDLKTSNILLDEEMNPKISDFGMARIFGGKQTQANTTRVVGTYGYMSPEYAIDGLFSIKSDVFSFGVVVLEIVSGKRNTLFYHKEQALTLLGYAWKLWYENMGLDLMDPSLREDCNEGQALRCIQVALLCVQDDAADRPTMTEVVFMLSSETAVVPNPRQPIFVVKRFSESLASSSNQGTGSNNELTITFEGR